MATDNIGYGFMFDEEQVEYFDKVTHAAGISANDIAPKGLTSSDLRMLTAGDEMEYLISKNGEIFKVSFTIESRKFTINDAGNKKMVFQIEGLEIKKIRK